MSRGDPLPNLTGEGARRRDAMLELLLAAQRREALRRRRVARAMRATAACLLLAGAGAAAWLLRPSPLPTAAPRTNGPAPVATSAPEATRPPAAPAAAPTTLVRWVPGDPTVLDRLRAVGTGQTSWLDDEALLERLRASGRPAGLVRIDGRTTLTADVTDKDRDAPRSSGRRPQDA